MQLFFATLEHSDAHPSLMRRALVVPLIIPNYWLLLKRGSIGSRLFGSLRRLAVRLINVANEVPANQERTELDPGSAGLVAAASRLGRT